jgi:hypothetical protein
MNAELTRQELLDVALLDVLADAGILPAEVVVAEARQWCGDHDAWSPDVLHLIEEAPSTAELEERLEFLSKLGMVRRSRDVIEITRAGYQLWDGFPWQYASEEEPQE